LAELDRVEQVKEAALAQGASASAGAAPAASGAEGAAPPAEGEEPPMSEAEAAERRTRAEGLKLRGNECLKTKTKSASREALEFYTAGLEVRCVDRVLTAQLYSNRAHVRILLAHFVEAVDDCRKAIEIDQKNMKAYFRAATASLKLDLMRNAIEFCEAGLKQDPNDADIMRLCSTAAEKLGVQQKKRAEADAATRAGGDFNAEEAMAVQEKVNELAEQCDMMKGTLYQKQREQHKAQLTEKTLADQPQETRMYIGVGRTFLKEPREAIEQKLTAKLEKLTEEIPRLEKTYQEMERRKDAAEKEFREMVSSYKQTAA